MGYRLEDLEIYQEAREFRKKIYQLLKLLPGEEKFSLVSQMRRAAISLTNNIAEGHGRFHYQENIQFLRQSRGSLEELIDDINICLDEGYISSSAFEELKSMTSSLLKKMNGYIRYLRSRKLEETTLDQLTT